MLSRTLKLLELDKVLDRLSDYAVTDPGRRWCARISPLSGAAEVRDSVALLREAMAWQGESGFSLSAFPDLDGVFLALQRPGAKLEIEAFWGLQQAFASAGKAMQALDGIDPARFPHLQIFSQGFAWPQKLAAAVKRCLDDSGQLKDESSPALAFVRGEIRSLREKCTKKVQDNLQGGQLYKYLQDEFLTISSDRYVLALKTNFKGRLKGIVHDYSQTGETCYFEPLFLMDLNNRLQGLKREEKEETDNILDYLTSLASQEKGQLRLLYTRTTEMDALLAKCALGREMDGTALDVSQNERLALNQARHPILALRKGFVQPVDIALDEGQRMLIISGGNSGGKTVALKTLGLCACMASCGLPVPVAEGSELPFWPKIFVSMGDEQSLEENLSTFTAQIRHLRDFWPQVDPFTLVILDEFGAGTSPSQGAALAQAVLDGLADRGAWVG
ncbi:MAG: endonuclease MutS2, partial [Desulfonatronovibrionaceae bacterium]